MNKQLGLARIVYATPDSAEAEIANRTLLRLANTWLQRQARGIKDSLLIIGKGYSSDDAFRSDLALYGLGAAERELIDLADSDDNDAVSTVVELWIAKRCASMIPLASLHIVGEARGYPDKGWWWIGLEATAPEAAAELVPALASLLPSPFQLAAETWAWAALLGVDDPDDEELGKYDRAMRLATLARWLHGFNQISGNDAFDFDAGETIEILGVDNLRLGFEGGRSSAEQLATYFDGEEEYRGGSLASQTMIVCLQLRTHDLKLQLASAFDGDARLFWALYSSIWPEMSEPVDEAFTSLMSLHRLPYSELEQPWMFVTNGWGDVDEG